MGKEAKKSTNAKENKKGKVKPKTNTKKIFFAIPVIIILLIAVVFVILNFTDTASGEEVQAELIIDFGTVEVKHNTEDWIEAENGTLLYAKDSIRTGEDSSASVVFFKSSVIRLDSNTEITIAELISQEQTSVSINQDSGRTWNTVSKVSGIDNYDVQTPTTVATVRGTAFDVYILPDGNTTIGVDHGTVNVTQLDDNGTGVGSVDVSENQSATINPSQTHGNIVTGSFVPDDWVLKNQQKDDEIILMGDSDYINGTINVKQALYARLEPYMDQLYDLGFTDQELEVLIDAYLLGTYDLPADFPDWAKEVIQIS